MSKNSYHLRFRGWPQKPAPEPVPADTASPTCEFCGFRFTPRPGQSSTCCQDCRLHGRDREPSLCDTCGVQTLGQRTRCDQCVAELGEVEP